MKYLPWLWPLCVKPVWGWNILWLSNPHNPLNRSKRRIRRVGEYEQLAFPLAEVLQKTCGANLQNVNDVLERFKGVPLRRDLGGKVIPAAFDASEEFAALCYSMVRLRKPSTVVETGVGRGVTSYYMLQALEENALGHLYSIELPWLKRGYRHSVGKYVPASLRSRWTLIFGSGAHEMRRILNTVGAIDMFVHDSAHTYLNQLAEYRIALAGMKTGGVLVSDDVVNDALLEASEEFGYQPIVATQSECGYIGIIVKESNQSVSPQLGRHPFEASRHHRHQAVR